jgi:signal transduction histidine kinase
VSERPVSHGSLVAQVGLALGLGLGGMAATALLIVTITLAPDGRHASSFYVVAIAVALVVVAVCVGVGRRVAKVVLAPVADLAEHLDFLAESGERVAPRAERPLKEIAQVYAAVQRFVSKGHDREERLATAVGALAHDVRADLRAIATVLDQGRNEEGDLALSPDVAQATIATVARSRVLVGDLVLLLGLGGGAASLRPIDVVPVVEAACRSSALVRAIDIDLVVERSFVRPVDPEVLDRILRNLLDNAVRHARSRVNVTLYEGVIAIADDGPGGLQTPGASASGIGHGFGFEIARRLAVHSGGRVVIERSGPTGTLVLVYL